MKYSPNELISALKWVFEAYGLSGLNIGQYRDLCDCVEIARAAGAFDKKQVTMYADRLFDEQCRNEGDAIADIDAGVDDVFDKLEDNE